MEEPREPSPMSRGKAIAYAIGLPLALIGLLFVPAGTIRWQAGWIFFVVLVVAFGASALVLARVNPMIYRARSRFQPGTERWDKLLLTLMLPIMVAILPIAALDAARHWSTVPLWAAAAGYAALLAGIAVSTWAQAVNPFFEPGVRIQSERHQRVIDSGPYRIVRHPGYTSALLIFLGMALALGSLWALIPATIASAILVLRTMLEDRLLRTGLAGYRDYALHVRWRLMPAIW